MAKVRIPFKAHFKPQMLAGTKICTSRTYNAGQVGDTFTSFGTTFVITHKTEVPLWLVKEKLYKAEGFNSPEEFVMEWCNIHPVKGFNPEQRVFTYFFTREVKP